MKILFVSNLFPDMEEPKRGRDNAEMVRQLAKQAEVRVVALRPGFAGSGSAQLKPLPQDRKLKPIYLNVPYVLKTGSAVNHRLYARALTPVLREIVAEWKPDVVLGAWLYPDACAVSRVCAGLKVPMIVVAQGADAFDDMRNARRRRLILDMVDNRAVAVIARNEGVAEQLVSAGAGTRHIYTVCNGVDHTVFHPTRDRAALRKKLGLPVKSPVVLYVGRFRAEKDPRTLIAGFEIVAHAFPAAIAVFCGDGPLRRQTAKDLDHAELLGHCRLEGTVKSEVVAQWMQAADLLVLTDRTGRGTPTVILEAFSCGTPVVATSVGGIPDVIIDPGLGRTVPVAAPDALATAIAAVLHDPPDGALIAEHAEIFHWDTTIRDLLTIISDVT